MATFPSQSLIEKLKRVGTSPAALLLPIIAAYLFHAHWVCILHDDAFISFRYSKHLAAGHGLVWNIGEPPVEGYTNFLWVILLAAAIKLGGTIETFSYSLGIGLGAITLVLVHHAARSIFQRKHGSLVAPVLLAASPSFVAWAGSGMETPSTRRPVAVSNNFGAAWSTSPVRFWTWLGQAPHSWRYCSPNPESADTCTSCWL